MSYHATEKNPFPKYNFSARICRLCGLNSTIENSHVIPAFVYKAIKKKSKTGYIRRTLQPNKRWQDGEKYPLLCDDCENRFNKHETIFHNLVFKPFREGTPINPVYENWLHYFITSVTWRTLVLDLETSTIPEKNFLDLASAETIMKDYLLGKKHLANTINNHALFITSDTIFNVPHLSSHEMKQSTSGYTIWREDTKCSSVIVNLAGFLCITHIKLDPLDIWSNTQIHPVEGCFTLPQNTGSWVVEDFLITAIDHRNSYLSNLSEKQRLIIDKSVQLEK